MKEVSEEVGTAAVVEGGGVAVEGVVIRWLGGNCPVQAEGTFDGAPFYFRARGTSVTCEAGDVANEWCWDGPVYEWPDAGWISEETALAFIATAYEEWKRGDYMERIAAQRQKNAERGKLLQDALRQARPLPVEPSHDSAVEPDNTEGLR